MRTNWLSSTGRWSPRTSASGSPPQEFTFDTFVVGPSNKLAYAASMAVAEHPAKNYNPLLIYGDSGLGKTHLLYAIANVIRKNDRNAKIVYIKGDDFINEFIELIRAGRGSEFRAKYREADLLLVDDVQFVAGKEQVQNEFFHTFNNLYESGKQIVLTSDRPPSEMTLLDDRLRTRFEWGLLADVTPPDFETRLAIVKNKAVALGMDLPDKIASYIAENVTANVRQLEGTVNKILAYKDLLGNEADEATVTRAMQDILKKSNEYIPTPDNILDYISKYYGIEKEIICGQQRVKDAVAARQIAMYLIRSMTNLPVVEIGKVFDNRDHSTVLYSLKQVEKQMKKDPAFAETVKEIKTNINNRIRVAACFTIVYLFPHFASVKGKTVNVEKESPCKTDFFAHLFSTSRVEAVYIGTARTFSTFPHFLPRTTAKTFSFFFRKQSIRKIRICDCLMT